jgi:hypothetical protein
LARAPPIFRNSVKTVLCERFAIALRGWIGSWAKIGHAHTVRATSRP